MKAALALLLGLVLSLLLIEGVLRVHNPISVPLRANEIVLPVNNVFVRQNPDTTKGDSVVRIKYNSLGFRGPEPPSSLADRLSIVTVGGSTTECVGLTDGHTWPDFLAAEISRTHPGSWLNNAGMKGHSTFGHLVLLESYLSSLRPKIILYLIGVNDVGRNDLNDYDLELDVHNEGLRNRIVASSELLATVQVLTRTLRAVDLGVRSDPGLDLLSLPRIEKDEDAIARAVQIHRSRYAESYRDRVRTLVERTREFDAQPVLITQPALYGSAVDPATGRELADLSYYDQGSSLRQWRILEVYNDVTREVAAEKHVLLVDLARDMPKDSSYYTDWLHFSVAGARKVAAIVFKGIEPVLEPHGC